MARKGNHQKNGVERHASNQKKKGSDSVTATKGRGKSSEPKVTPAEELQIGNQEDGSFVEAIGQAHQGGVKDRSRKNIGRSLSAEVHETNGLDQSVSPGDDCLDSVENVSHMENVGISDGNGTSSDSNFHPKCMKGFLSYLLNGSNNTSLTENVVFLVNLVVRNLRASSVSIWEAVTEWMEKQRPLIIKLSTSMYKTRDQVRRKIKQVYPVVLKRLLQFGNIMLLLAFVWLDCMLRGVDSFLQMGTSSFFLLIWCIIFSVIAMAGMSKLLIVTVAVALTAMFAGLTLASLVVAISGAVALWLYGSFWTTMFVIFLGGLTFISSHERVALLITTLYSLYCAWMYVGWLGLLLALNLSFISSDVLIYFLKNNINPHRRHDRSSEHTNGMRGQSGYFSGESAHASSSDGSPSLSADPSPGIPSTSGAESELTSEEEIVRLLKCSDHYSVLGLSRYEDVDVSFLKREYRKKAMLVHPDKNMHNEKSAEAFQKLQNAYEVLLDSLKRKSYDDELRQEELLNYFRRFQGASQKKGGLGFFSSGFTNSEADSEDPFGHSRRIACKKCSMFHVWALTKKSKSQARWCQDCKELHPAKDGEGWIEQSSQPILFGVFQKVDAPSAYVCADGKIYDASEWYICQGMRCPANTHKPSFHVNTSVTSKHSSGKGSSSSQRGGTMPTSNMEESMTEEEFFEWLQNAMQAGMFENFGGENPSAKAGSGAKSSNNPGSGSSTNKRKKKGKKQW